jgi:hypothetical protein
LFVVAAAVVGGGGAAAAAFALLHVSFLPTHASAVRSWYSENSSLIKFFRLIFYEQIIYAKYNFVSFTVDIM